MEFLKYITDNSLILIPVLYILGLILKQVNFVKDKYIPLILLPIGIGFSLFLTSFDIYGIVQGILVVGVTVYGNQVFKQCLKKRIGYKRIKDIILIIFIFNIINFFEKFIKE